MKNVASSAGVVAVVALALHLVTSQDKQGGENHARTASRSIQLGAEQSAPSAGLEASSSESPKIEGPWLATQAFFEKETKGGLCRTAATPESAKPAGCSRSLDFTQPHELETCAADASCSELMAQYFGVKGRDIQYLIATIPDPLHTRLALLTDSSIEALNQAAFDSHWELAAQWLPWYDNADPGDKDPEERRKERASVRDQESQPGLLIFRHSPTPSDVGDQESGATSSAAPKRSPHSAHNRAIHMGFDEKALFVFLVGETPTGGINGVEYRTARAYMRAFGDPQDVRMVGPTFSGSFDSLAQLINMDRSRASAGSPATEPQYWVHTGTATNAEAEQAFLSKAKAQLVRSNQNSEEDLSNFNRILEQLRIPPRQAATLVEDDTAFSKGFAGSRQKSASMNNAVSRILRFPRDISHLRNVYRDATSTSSSGNTNGQAIDFSLKDNESGEDTVPVFSATQTPLSQNAVIGELVNEIRGDRLRLIELAATNVLDSLFLANVLRRQCPDTRLLITSPDLLFVQATQTESLDGILALSTYPLFSASKRFLSNSAATMSVDHANANAAGIYTAASLYLLPPQDRAALNPYAGPNAQHPPAWLMQLNRQGFSPIRLIHDDQRGPTGQKVKDPSPRFWMPYPSSVWIATVSLLSMFTILLCSWMFHLERTPRASSWCIPAVDGNHIADAYRLMFLMYALLTLAAAEAVLYIPLATSLWPRSEEGRGDYLLHALALSGLFLPLATSVWLLRRILQKPRLGITRFAYSVAGFAMAAWICLVWSICCWRDPHDHLGFFFACRALELRTGTSPALPVLLLLLALFLFAIGHLVRFHFAISQRPRLFTATLDRFLKGRMRNSRSELNRALVAPMNFSGKRQLTLILTIVAMIVLVGILCRADQKLSTPEGRAYDTVVLTLVALVVVAIVATALQVKFSWAALQPLLVRLDLLPLGSAFTELRDAGRNGPIWARRLNLQSLDIPSRSVMVLHNLKVSLTNQTNPFPALSPDRLQTWIDEYWAPLSKLISERQLIELQTVTGLRTAMQRMNRLSLRREFGRMRYRSAEISHELTERVLIPEWRKRSLPWTPAEPSDSKKSEAVEEGPYELAQTFVALQFSMFINYGLRQMQNLLLSVSLGYGLLVAALSVYRFEAPQLVGRFLLAGFAILGFFTWRVMSQMERDPILSRLSGTSEGELTREFYVKLIGYGAIPLLSLLSSQFPAIGGFLSSWVQPSLEALK